MFEVKKKKYGKHATPFHENLYILTLNPVKETMNFNNNGRLKFALNRSSGQSRPRTNGSASDMAPKGTALRTARCMKLS